MTVVVTAAPAHAADGWQRTNDVDDSKFDNDYYKRCEYIDGGIRDHATGCFQPYGDWVWLEDQFANNMPVGVVWGYSGPGGSRSGVIYNDRGTDAGMTNLNKNFREGGTFTFKVCEVDIPRNMVKTQTCSYPASVTT